MIKPLSPNDLPKYMRIQGREIAWVTKKPVGVFTLCVRKIRDEIFSKTDVEKFHDAEKWFNENLPHPPFYGENNNDATANTQGAITYFKTANATIMLENLAPIFELLEKYQVPYDIVYTNFPGKIIYEDEYQVGVVDAPEKEIEK